MGTVATFPRSSALGDWLVGVQKPRKNYRTFATSLVAAQPACRDLRGRVAENLLRESVNFAFGPPVSSSALVLPARLLRSQPAKSATSSWGDLDCLVGTCWGRGGAKYCKARRQVGPSIQATALDLEGTGLEYPTILSPRSIGAELPQTNIDQPAKPKRVDQKPTPWLGAPVEPTSQCSHHRHWANLQLSMQPLQAIPYKEPPLRSNF